MSLNILMKPCIKKKTRLQLVSVTWCFIKPTQDRLEKSNHARQHTFHSLLIHILPTNLGSYFHRRKQLKLKFYSTLWFKQ